MSRFPAYTTPRPLAFLSIVSNTGKIALVANLGKTFLAKETTRSNNAFFVQITHHIIYHFTKEYPWSNYFRQLSFIMFYIVDMLLANAFPVARNNSCSNYSSWKFVIEILRLVLCYSQCCSRLLFCCRF